MFLVFPLLIPSPSALRVSCPRVMMKLVFFLVVLQCLGFQMTIMYTIAIGSLKPGEHMDELTPYLCSATSTYCMEFRSTGDGQDYLVTFDSREGGAESSESVVLVANRDEPLLTDGNNKLTLNLYGELKITHSGENPIILYSPSNQSQHINNTVATLLDSGNFVLQQLHPNGSKSLLWQSFDYPTNKLLPGMKLGVNHKTGKNWSLVSYNDASTPASGSFSLEWEPKIGQLIIRRRGQDYWGSGELRNNKFKYISERSQIMYDYLIVSNEDEDSITFTSQSNQHEAQWVMSFGGQLMDVTGNFIASGAGCYVKNSYRGCLIENDFRTCRNGYDGFISMYLKDAQKINASSNSNDSSLVQCLATCWGNCDCVGFADLHASGNGCYFVDKHSWQNIQKQRGGGGQQFYIVDRISATPPATPPDHKVDRSKKLKAIRKKWKWIIPVIVISLFTICACMLWIVRSRRKFKLEGQTRTKIEHIVLNLENSSGYGDRNENQHTLNNGHDLRLFSYASIMEATNGFSPNNKLGQGGFGPVYKGTLMETEVAVKRLSKSSRQGAAEFKTELRLVSELQHVNLVQLLGCCIHGEERILVYEYLPNKSLDFFLFDSTQSKLLDWKKRHNIIEGIAQGLLYLHKYSRLRIVHRDLKASNILLDAYMNPKISDFGMARIFIQESAVNTTRIVGTLGYMPPEYAMKGVFSIKSDVYSFGVLVLEIVSGRRNNSFHNASDPINLVGHAWELWKDGLVLQLIDPAIHDSVVKDQVLRCIHVGLLCVEESADDRPTMSETLSMLTNSYEMLPLLKKPAFYFRGRDNAANESPRHLNIDTINEMSVSDFSAR